MMIRLSTTLLMLSMFASCQDANGGTTEGVPYDPSCGDLTNNNEQGVGAACTKNARQLACPLTRMCFAEIVGDELARETKKSFCTKECSTDRDCGEQAHCCRPPGATGKFCVLDTCTSLCD